MPHGGDEHVRRLHGDGHRDRQHDQGALHDRREGEDGGKDGGGRICSMRYPEG
jgi:hypothetical protein